METRRYWIEGASAAVPLYSSFSFSLHNRACRQLAKLLLLWKREEVEEEVEVTEWGLGPVAQTVLGSCNVASVIKRVCPRFVPVIFPVVPVFTNDS